MPKKRDDTIIRPIWLYTNHDELKAFANQTDATEYLDKHSGRVRKIMLKE